MRIGQGFDIHQLVEGRPLILGGVHIPNAKGLLGHSDADVLLHALIDALLGAAGKGDIGCNFPNTDMQWKDAQSTDLLRRVMRDLKQEGWRVINVDCTVVAEAPKINPYIEQMKHNLAELLEVTPADCGVKATTAERLGAIGRGEGIMALCVALIERASI